MYFRHLDLFAGIGGFSLAASWMGWETVAQVEWDKWCQKVLAKNFPDALRFGDIVEFNKMLQNGEIITDTVSQSSGDKNREVGNEEWRTHENRGTSIRQKDGSISTGGLNTANTINGKLHIGHIDIITGGFPCQPFSHAGKRKGVADERYLWPEMLRTIRIFKPSFVVGENVAGLVSMDNGKTLDGILADLENEGYQVESFIIPACAVGAWHRRDRIWIIGRNVRYAQSEGLERRNRMGSAERLNERCENVSDSNNRRCEKQRLNKSIQSNIEREAEGIESEYSGGCNGRELKARAGQLKPTMGGVVTGLSLELDGYWDREPDGVPRVATGVKDRVNRLKGLGNAIVPQVVFQIYQAIEEFCISENKV